MRLLLVAGMFTAAGLLLHWVESAAGEPRSVKEIDRKLAAQGMEPGDIDALLDLRLELTRK